VAGTALRVMVMIMFEWPSASGHFSLFIEFYSSSHCRIRVRSATRPLRYSSLFVFSA